jgi:hypothetical protein
MSEIRTNAKNEVIVPFHRPGAPEVDLAELMEALRDRKNRG